MGGSGSRWLDRPILWGNVNWDDADVEICEESPPAHSVCGRARGVGVCRASQWRRKIRWQRPISRACGSHPTRFPVSSNLWRARVPCGTWPARPLAQVFSTAWSATTTIRSSNLDAAEIVKKHGDLSIAGITAIQPRAANAGRAACPICFGISKCEMFPAPGRNHHALPDRSSGLGTCA